MKSMKNKIPLLENMINVHEEIMKVSGKGEFVIDISARDNYVYLHMIPDSKMLDSIESIGKNKFVDDAIRFLSNKLGVDFREEAGPHAGYMFKFHVSELIKGMEDIIKWKN